ncbi:general substrate transporter [Hortaea werneckii]|nr:general substrate transporter [Hortaea werneckii]
MGFMLIGYDNGLMGGLVSTKAFDNTFGINEKTDADLIALIVAIMAEFAPKASRGIFVCAQLSTLNFGVFLVYWIDDGFVTAPTADQSFTWRIPVILQCVLPVAMLVIVFIIPETPRWLASHDRSNEALAVLRRLYKHFMSDEDVVQAHQDIMRVVSYEYSFGAGRWRDVLKSDAIKSRRRFLIACGCQIFQRLGGINAIIYYSNYIFQNSVGMSHHLASLMSGILNAWFFAASFIPWFLIDRIGRRPLLLSMVALMAGVMATQTGLIYAVENNPSMKTQAGIGAAAMLFIFQGAFTIGFQATVWVYPSEILPLKLRQRGSSISTACNWICNFIIVYNTPPAIQNIGYRTYIIFAVLNTTWLPIMYFFFPETKGLALEDVDQLFLEKNGQDIEDLTRYDTAEIEAVKAEERAEKVGNNDPIPRSTDLVRINTGYSCSMALPNNCRRIPKEEKVVSTAIADNGDPQRPFAVYNDDFLRLIGNDPTVSVVLKRDYNFALEAPVFDPKGDAVYFCSNLLGLPDSDKQTITIHKTVKSPTGKWDCHDIQPNLAMCNGGINYGDDILFCSQGTMSEPGRVVKMSRVPPYNASTLVDGFFGRQLNSVNDLVVHHDGSIWFTDPMYGWEQGFRPKPRLPCQVYRFDSESGDMRAVADSFGRPNGLCFSPDQRIMYITDTDIIHGDGNFDETRPGTIYAFSVWVRDELPIDSLVISASVRARIVNASFRTNARDLANTLVPLEVVKPNGLT